MTINTTVHPVVAIFSLLSVTPAATLPALQGPYGQLLAGFILPSDLDDRLAQYLSAIHHQIVTMPTDTVVDRVNANFLADVRQALLAKADDRPMVLLSVVAKYSDLA